MNIQAAKGTRDYTPEEKIARNELTAKLVSIFERYGFSPLETPLIERMDVLGAKYASGDESDAMKEVFRFKDQGGRELGLRYDLTVPLARYISMNPELKMPFKRYQIGTVFRDGPIKTGRYRQFEQYDIDIIGAATQKAEAEVIRVVLAVFDEVGFDVRVNINNRKLLAALIEKTGVKKEQTDTVIVTLDKIDKIGRESCIDELREKGVDNAERILSLLQDRTIEEYEQLLEANEGIDELKELFSLLPQDKRIVFLPSLARGLAYYTGTVIEVYGVDKDINFSLAGGGRYDRMIGLYSGSKQDIPAVGLSFGFEPILEVLKKQQRLSGKKSMTIVYVSPIGAVNVNDIVDKLRKSGINTDVDLQGRGVSKNIRYADSYGIPYVLFVGEDELASEIFTLKNMQTGEEKKGPMEDLIAILGKSGNTTFK